MQRPVNDAATMTTSSADGPLGGIRILDLTSVIMGPFATHVLADLGADVIKVESPEGDSLRHHEPLRHPGMSGSFLNLHRNKRSIVLDLKGPECRLALNRLIETADVFVHSLRSKTIERLGYGYEQVRAMKPDIVYCAACGFGSQGPYGDKPAYDDAIQAGSGMSALHAQLYGEPGYVPTVVCDKLSGQAVAYAILAALFQRARGGGGQAIEVPMLETSIEFNLAEHMGGSAFVPPLGQPGYTRLLSRRRKPYRTRDGYACILPYSDRNWQDFYDFTGRTEFKDDPRFRRLTDRVDNIAVLYEMIQEEALKRTTAQWLAFCDRVSIPCMPVLSLAELPEDPHVKAVGLFGTAEHPSEGLYRTVRNPVSFSAAPFRIRRHAPRLGAHTAEVLAEAGLSSQQIQAVIDAGAASGASGAQERNEP
jgi:crotonobetainyl-CoA:carnitine CoA-transferase CaiB-like acyl-CoA transferase